MTAPIKTDQLYSAYYAQMLADPKLANEVITGSCSWPPADADKLDMGDALWNLWLHADELVAKDQELTRLFASGGRDTTGSVKLRAARDAISKIMSDHANRDRDAWDEYPVRQSMSRGWQKVL